MTHNETLLTVFVFLLAVIVIIMFVYLQKQIANERADRITRDRNNSEDTERVNERAQRALRDMQSLAKAMGYERKREPSKEYWAKTLPEELIP
jgi:predicted Holliday junction resolvase-like endonuclease